MEKEMKSDTFGNYRASKILAEILNEKPNKKHSAKVSRSICRYNNGLSNIATIKNIRLLKTMLGLWYDYNKKLITEIDLPTVIKTHVLNIMTCKYREMTEPISVVWQNRKYLNKDVIRN